MCMDPILSPWFPYGVVVYCQRDINSIRQSLLVGQLPPGTLGLPALPHMLLSLCAILTMAPQ